MSETIQDLRLQADGQIAELVGDMTRITSKIDKLNDDIIANSSVGRDVTDLKDQRGGRQALEVGRYPLFLA